MKTESHKEVIIERHPLRIEYLGTWKTARLHNVT